MSELQTKGETQSKRVIQFHYVSPVLPLYDLGWEPVVSDDPAATPEWQMVVGATPDEVAQALDDQAAVADRWEAYAAAVTQAVDASAGPVADPHAPEASAEAMLGHFEFVDRGLRQPLRVTTYLDGKLLARTTLNWQASQETVWSAERFAPEWAPLHLRQVEIAGRMALALLQRELVVVSAVGERQDAGLEGLEAWSAVQAAASAIGVPDIAELQKQAATNRLLAFDWCEVPGGPFPMGDPVAAEKSSGILNRIRSSFSPQSTATEGGVVDCDAFWMARAPVTNAQYRLFIEAGGYAAARYWTAAGRAWVQGEKVTKPDYWSDRKFSGAQQPVVGVSWYEAMAFCRWASEVSGETIQLPTEAQWEKAARGSDGRDYPWGNEPPTEKLCDFDGSVGRTTPVGQYSPQGDSPYGCTDMAGNVWEWCLSQYQDYPYQADDGRNGVDSETSRVVRGGLWSLIDGFARASYRNGYGPSYRYSDVGFRLSRVAAHLIDQ